MRANPPLAALLAATLSTLAASRAIASWPFDASTNLPVCSAGGSQGSVVAIADGVGGVILAWVDHRTGPGYDIYVQRISWSGATAWTADGVLLRSNAGSFSYPVIASDGAGGAIVAWMDTRSGNDDIYAQRVSAAGVPLWAANGVAACAFSGNQVNPRIVADGAGGAFLAWQDTRTTATPDLYAQHLDGSGTALWGAGAVVCAAANSQDVPALVADGLGGMVAAWGDLRGTDEDIYAQRLNAAGAAMWTADGVPVCQALNDQRAVTMVADGFGGALLAWQDERNGLNVPDIYAQRVSVNGTRLWTTPSAEGVPLATVNGSQTSPQAASDGVGGMIVAWQTDHNAAFTGLDIYAQRVSGAGATLWGVPGLGNVITSAAGDQAAPVVAPDEQGGAVIAWQDHRSGQNDVYARRITSSGALQWQLGGRPVSLAAGDQTSPVIVDDGAGGAVIAWADARSDAGDVYAERIEPSGELGNPAPFITAVTDAPADNGGHVRLHWTPSDRDTAGDPGINSYRIWRAVPPQSAALAAFARRRAWTADPDEAAATGELLVSAAMGAGYAWELIGTDAPQSGAQRVFDAPTTSDSLAGSNPCTVFMVEALGPLNQHWASPPDSGYSVDNLAPATPAGFVGAYATGFTHLSWSRNGEPDFGVYRLYRGSTADFVPASTNLLSVRPDTGYVDVVGSPFFYKLTASDVHGLESAPALVSPTGTTGVGGSGPPAVEFAAPAPNPARLGTSLRWALPGATRVRLSLYDAAGRRVRTIADDVEGAGEHVIRVALHAEDGRALPSGEYLLRFETAARAFTRRLTVVR